MRMFIGFAVVISIGLIWSVAAMSKLVPVPSEDLKTAGTSTLHISSTMGQAKRACLVWSQKDRFDRTI
jgi:hypothetical protein